MVSHRLVIRKILIGLLILTLLLNGILYWRKEEQKCVCDCPREYYQEYKKNQNMTRDESAQISKFLHHDQGGQKQGDLGDLHEFTTVLGQQRLTKGFLTVGIPSIRRRHLKFGWEYLLDTIQSIVDTTTDSHKEETTVVVFLADFDKQYKVTAARAIYDKFKKYLDMGFLLVVQVDRNYYPSLNGLKRNFNDKPDRVTWRSKQNIDFSFMFVFSSNISSYYIQIEDDLETSERFPDAIKSYIKEQDIKHPRWVDLDFSELGFIGKLFTSSNALKLGHFLKIFYQEQPCDWLISYFKLVMLQRETYHRKPSIFEHKGSISSLRGTKNRLRDRFYIKDSRAINNPPAKLYTTMKIHLKNNLDQLYHGLGKFWAQTPKDGDYLLIKLENPIRLGIVFIQTGHTPPYKQDSLTGGVVQASSADSNGDCNNYVNVAVLHSKQKLFFARDLERKFTFLTKCVRLLLTKSQSQWLAIPALAIIGIPA